MRISIHKIKSSLGNHVLVYVKSNLSEDYPQLLQDYLSRAMAAGGELYDPRFPWETAEVSMIYFGLQGEADQWEFQLPDGRTARAWNINPGYTNRMARVFKDYSAAMDVARTALLQDKSPEQAARKLWEYCEENQVILSLIEEPEKFGNVVLEMEEYSGILEEDILDLWVRAGNPPETLPYGRKDDGGVSYH